MPKLPLLLLRGTVSGEKSNAKLATSRLTRGLECPLPIVHRNLRMGPSL
jgi:hypothetical protein